MGNSSSSKIENIKINNNEQWNRMLEKYADKLQIPREDLEKEMEKFRIEIPEERSRSKARSRSTARNIELGSVRRPLSPDTKRALDMMQKVRRQRKFKRITGMQAAREARSIKGDGIDMSILSPLTADERHKARKDYKASKAVRLGGKKMNTKKLHRLRNKKRKRKTRRKRKTI